MTHSFRARALVGISAGALALAGLALPAGADQDVPSPGPDVTASTAGQFIDNGIIQLGVHSEGHLNVAGGPASLSGTTAVGLRYLPTNAEFTAPGCLCEGWGAGDATTGNAGYANEAVDGIVNIAVESADFTASEAKTVGLIGSPAILRVTHHYYPAPETPNLYRVDVTLENISGAPIDTRYKRVMDWDIEPTPFREFSTIVGAAAATDVIASGNNGFDTANPLTISAGTAGDFTDLGPADHGAVFQFGFGTLAPGASTNFVTYYGAAGDEKGALAALAAVGAEVYSLGQPTTTGPTVGEPNTAIFAFGDVGGTAVVPSARLGAASYSVTEGDGVATIDVELTEAGTDPVEVDVVTADGTATNGSDYTGVTTTLTFAPGDTAKSFTIPIIDDAVDEPDETVDVSIADVRGAFTGTPAAATLTIVDDDAAPPTGELCNGLTPTIVGTDGPDVIHGTSGPDVILAKGGDDKVYSHDGDDVICLGDGDDYVASAWGADWIDGGAGDDEIYSGGHGDTVYGGPDDDDIYTGLGYDLAWGEEGNDYLHSTKGRDGLAGGPGDDLIVGGAGNDSLSGGPGNDILKGNADDDELDGGDGMDKLFGASGDDELDGGPGDDRQFASDGNDTCVTSPGDADLNKDCETVL